MSEQAQPGEAQQGRVETRRIYLRDLSFESPHATEGQVTQWQPDINLNINHQSSKQGEQLYEVRLRCTVTCRNNKKTAYLLEVDQAGLFFITGVPDSQLKTILGTFCPNMLFPYIREAVDNLLVKGGFPPLMLAPVNFDALYAQSVKDKQQDQEGEKPVVH